MLEISLALVVQNKSNKTPIDMVKAVGSHRRLYAVNRHGSELLPVYCLAAAHVLVQNEKFKRKQEINI